MRTVPGAVVLVAFFALLTGAGAVGWQVYGVLHPPRAVQDPTAVASAVVKLQEASFESSDGVPLAGWILEGDPLKPFIVICHELGAGKASVVDLGILLQKEGFNVLLFDFRGHGRSGGGASGLGGWEKRDVIGAIDFLASRQGVDVRQVGLFGVGMGAHAAVLAAAERPSVRVLVLDGLYPDPAFALTRRVYGAWSFGAEHLGFAPRTLFAMLKQGSTSGEGAAAALPRLVGRDVLMIAPAADNVLNREMQAMVATIPNGRNSEGNLVVLPGTRLGSLYGEDLEQYQSRVTDFFRSRLLAAS